jgi:hypothetical protein
MELVALCETPDMGVCGGVVKGRVGGWAEFAAVTSGTEPRVGVGLFMTVAADWWAEIVLIDDAEDDRAGLAGRHVTEGDADIGLPLMKDGETLWLSKGIGVWQVDGAVDTVAWCGADTGATYGCPSSPGEKDNVEQKPSDELMINVNPSLDLSLG